MQLPEPQGTGNGYPAFKFKDVGDSIAGEITSEPRQVTTKAIEQGKPDVDNIVFELHTDAPVSCKGKLNEVVEGQDWTIWIPIRSQRYTALYEAVVGAGHKLSVGARIAIRLANLEDVGKPSPMKVFEVAYKPAAPAAAGEPASVAALLGD